MNATDIDVMSNGAHCTECAMRRLAERLAAKLKEVAEQRDDLLSACDAAVGLLDTTTQSGRKAYDMARAAIAKVEGGI